MDKFKLGDTGLSIPLDEAFNRGTETWKVLENNTLYINIETLIRNVIGCKVVDTVTKDDVKDLVISDLSLLANLLQFTNIITYYVNERSSSLSSLFTFKEARTDKQKEYEKLHKSVLKELITSSVNKVFTRSVNIPNGFIITHFPVDLLFIGAKVKLVECHTGVIKSSNQFNTKLNIRKELRMFIPFNVVSLFMFGDGVYIERQKPKLSNAFLELCKNNLVTPITTETRIRNLLSMNLPDVYHTLRKL